MKNQMNQKNNNQENNPEKIVNLFEDTGNFHDEEALSKSYERTAEYQQQQMNQRQTEE